MLTNNTGVTDIIFTHNSKKNSFSNIQWLYKSTNATCVTFTLFTYMTRTHNFNSEQWCKLFTGPVTLDKTSVFLIATWFSLFTDLEIAWQTLSSGGKLSSLKE